MATVTFDPPRTFDVLEGDELRHRATQQDSGFAGWERRHEGGVFRATLGWDIADDGILYLVDEAYQSTGLGSAPMNYTPTTGGPSIEVLFDGPPQVRHLRHNLHAIRVSLVEAP